MNSYHVNMSKLTLNLLPIPGVSPWLRGTKITKSPIESNTDDND